MIYKWLLAFTFITFCAHAEIALQDSVSVIEKNGRPVVIHEVGAKETIYSIARKYGISHKAIVAINPEVDAGIKAGQKIFVPYTSRSEKKNTSNQNQGEVVKNSPVVQPSAGKIYHTVETGQTLYSISKRYNVAVEDVKKWNEINEDKNLKLGSMIVVGLEGEGSSKGSSSKNTKEITRSNTGYEKIVENGMIEFFETPEGNTFHFALHKTAPVGTIIKVNNEDKSASVFVRIIGKLPETVNAQVVLRISKIAMERLGVTNKSFKGEISYLP